MVYNLFMLYVNLHWMLLYLKMVCVAFVKFIFFIIVGEDQIPDLRQKYKFFYWLCNIVELENDTFGFNQI